MLTVNVYLHDTDFQVVESSRGSIKVTYELGLMVLGWHWWIRELEGLRVRIRVHPFRQTFVIILDDEIQIRTVESQIIERCQSAIELQLVSFVDLWING